MKNPGAVVFSILALFCMGALLVVALLDPHPDPILFVIFGLNGFFAGLVAWGLWSGWME